nr:MAG TPA: hypothetical protein [Caudoviricetes sp.]
MLKINGLRSENQKTKLNKRRLSPRTAELRKRGATFQKLGNMTGRG